MQSDKISREKEHLNGIQRKHDLYCIVFYSDNVISFSDVMPKKLNIRRDLR